MPVTNATLERFYRWNAPIYDLTRWMLLRGRRAAVDALRLRPGDRVLEIGCGTGLNFARLRDNIGRQGQIVGVDLSEPMLARASRRCQGNVGLVRGDAARLPLHGPFDAVLMAYSLTMIPDWQSALAQACEVLKPRGSIVVLDFARRGRRFAPLHAVLERYLGVHHVDIRRDIQGSLRPLVNEVREHRLRCGYVTLLQGKK